MELIFNVLLGSTLFMYAWQMFGVSERKTTGIVGAVGALGIVSIATFKPVAMLTKVEAAPMAVLMFVGATYCALVAATGLWDFDTRGLGFWSILGVVTGLGQLAYSVSVAYHLSGIIEGIGLSVAFAVLFFHLGLRNQGLRLVTAWVFLVVSILFVLLTVGIIFKVPGLI